VAVGYGNIIDAPDCSAFGVTNTIGTSSVVTLVGNDNTAAGAYRSVVLGHQCQISADYTIAIGYGAINSAANTMVVGSNSVADIGNIHTVTFNGYNGAAIITLAATDNPANTGDIGLTVVHRTGVATVVNKTVKAAVAPPGGSLLLYVDP
jgi:hypothetical protein